MGRIRLGMLTPSSNTVVEPLCYAMTVGLPEVSVHFARFKVTEIGLGAQALAQFDDAPILAAARLLADAKVDVIAWNGTSGAWLGFDRDRALCERIESASGVPATTSMLALNEVLARHGIRRLGLVTPYLGDVQARIVATYAAAGIEVTSERHFGDPGNFSFAEITEAVIRKGVGDVAATEPDAIAIVCTNLWAAPLVPQLEAEHGVLIVDSLAAAVWQSLRLADLDPARVIGWGRLFQIG